jgi:hypothetical protein
VTEAPKPFISLYCSGGAPANVSSQFELSGRLVFVRFEMRDGPLVGVIVDPYPMDNLHDPFLLYVALHPSGCNPRKGT